MSGAQASRSASPEGEALKLLRALVAARYGAAWPSTRWQNDPVGFAETVLGVRIWDREAEFMEAVRDCRHVSVAAGRKVSKDHALACLSLWWWCSFPGAKVLCLAPTRQQIEDVLYLEIRKLHADSGRCIRCKEREAHGPRPCPHSVVLPGQPAVRAQTGLVSADFRSIKGNTAGCEDAMRGFSGDHLLAILDEATGIRDEIDAALLGNLASEHTRHVMVSNPTEAHGFFYRSHHEERALFRCLTISSEESPNVREGREVIPGLATSLWLAERAGAWGRGSRLWMANVEGKFPASVKGALFTIDDLQAAEARWADDVLPEGRLFVGVDPAGATHDGDETAICVRRGNRVHEIIVGRAWNEDRILLHVVEALNKWRRPEDSTRENRPTVSVDRDGAIGARTYDALRAWRDREVEAGSGDGPFSIYGFRGAIAPARMRETFNHARDFAAGVCEAWVKSGGAIPPDVKLEGDLLCLRWVDAANNKQVLVPKTELRELFHKSPDRYDALALSIVAEDPGRVYRAPSRAEAAVEAVAPRPQTVHEMRDDLEDSLGREQVGYGQLVDLVHGGEDPWSE